MDRGMELDAVHPDSAVSKGNGSSRRKYTATTTELIGPDKKKGCCVIV